MAFPFNIDQALPALVYQGLSRVWSTLDPRSRTLETAIDDGIARARAMAWTESASQKAGLPSAKSDGVADLRALVLATAISRNILLDSKRSDPEDQRFADGLTNTWVVIAKRSGYKGEKLEDIKKQDPSQANIELIGILAIVIGSVIIAAVLAFLIYKAAEVLERQMSISAESDELVRLHAETQKVLDNHIAQERAAGHPLPYTPDEIAILDKLAAAQKGVSEKIAPPPPAPPPGPSQGGWDMALLATVGGVLGLGYFFLSSKTK